MHFITQSNTDIQRKLQKPEPVTQTLVGEAFKHSNNRDLTEEVNKDKRLIKKTQLLPVLFTHHLQGALEG